MNSRPSDTIAFYIETVLDLQLIDTFSNKTFDQAVFSMTNKQNINGVQTLLSCLKKHTSVELLIQTREFLSLYMICFFHNDILSTKKNETEELLYEKCKELVYYIPEYVSNNDTLEDFDIDIYTKKLNTFSVLFSMWKKKDKESQKKIYLSLYLDYTDEIETFTQKANDINKFEYYKQYLQQLIDMRDKIKNCLIQLVGQQEYDILETDGLHPIGIFTKNSKHLIENYLIEAYWNIFKTNIQNKTIQDTNIITKLGVTVKHYFTHIYKKNEDKLQKLYNKIDFIIDKILQTQNVEDYIIDLIYLLYNELIFIQPTHSILSKVEEKLENIDTIDDSIYILKILMKEYNTYVIS